MAVAGSSEATTYPTVYMTVIDANTTAGTIYINVPTTAQYNELVQGDTWRMAI